MKGHSRDYEFEKRQEERKKLYERIYEVVKKGPHLVTEKDVQEMLNAPYPPGLQIYIEFKIPEKNRKLPLCLVDNSLETQPQYD
jgi:hypothetical protein